MSTPRTGAAADAALAKNNAVAPALAPAAPEFLHALNHCVIPASEDKPQHAVTKASDLLPILQQVESRLKGSLDLIWNSKYGHHEEWEVRPTNSAADNQSIVAEEEWARWCTELMAATNYNTTLAYGAYGPKEKRSQFSDNYFFQAFFSENPVVPVGMACQQLCNFAYYSRGYEYAEVTGNPPPDPNEPPPPPPPPGKKPKPKPKVPGVGVTASNNSHLNHLFVGGWDSQKKYGDLEEGFNRNPGSLGPGTIIAFLPAQLPTPPGSTVKKKQRRGSHVAFILRCSTKSRMAQFLDTGAVLRRASNNRSVNGATPFAMAGLVGGNYDDILYKGAINVRSQESGDVPCCGIGVLKPKKSPAQVRAAVARARAVRPLGFARLAIFTRGRGKDDKEVLYVSPVVWMHDTASAANYYISRMMWSMRKIPGYQNLQAIWQISYPMHELAGRLRNASRTDPLRIPWGKGGESKACVWLTSDETGQAFCLQRIKLLPTEPPTTEDEPALAKAPYTAVFSKLEKTKPNEHFVRGDLGALTPPKYFEPW